MRGRTPRWTRAAGLFTRSLKKIEFPIVHLTAVVLYLILLCNKKCTMVWRRLSNREVSFRACFQP